VNKIRQLFETFFRFGDNIDLKKKIAELQEQSIRDPLTRVYNRRFLEEVGEKEFALAKRYQRLLTLIFLDIDEFKRINDRQGHLVGDQALETVAALLANHSRKSDFIFRYGGDEFLVMMPEIGEEGARQFLNRIDHELSHTSLRISAGIATLEAESSLRELIDKADRRMYEEREKEKEKKAKLKALA
jgi:diguanylate cyclase (GGDEF)-like protein